MVLALTVSATPVASQATAAPVVDVTLATSKTGSEPFDDSTWDRGTATNAGNDANTDNNVVRLQDTVTYKVEASLNDAPVTDFVIEVLADPKEKWIRLPDECRDDGNPVSAILDSSGEPEGDQRLLRCNLGSALEGTNRVIYPVARVIAATYDGSAITINDDTVAASVSAYATGETGTSEVVEAGPVETIVTAGFEVDLIKTLKSTDVDDEGNPTYRPYYAVGPNGQGGTVIEYIISARYQNGSMLVDSDESTFLRDFSLIDYYSDDNPNNDVDGLSSGAVLYDWGPNSTACSLVGDHGAAAAVACSPSTIVADLAGPTYGPDGVNDRIVDVELSGIDVRDPDGDGNLFEIEIELWYEHASELRTDPSCEATSECEIFVVNGTGTYDAGSNTAVGFNPVSTEDASGNNLLNYNGDGEPHGRDVWADYPLYVTGPGGWSSYMSFAAETHWTTPAKADTTLKLAPGEVALVGAMIWDYRTDEVNLSQHCTKIDTSKMEYVGLSDAPTLAARYGYNRNRAQNPNWTLWKPGGPVDYLPADEDTITFWYSDVSHDSIDALYTDTCEDDANGDGTVNMVDADGVHSTPGATVDWYADPDAVPGGRAAIASIRYDYTYDRVKAGALSTDQIYSHMGVNYDVRVRPDVTSGYGSQDLLSIWSATRYHNGTDWAGWNGDESGVTNPEDAAFSYLERYADRAELVLSGHSLGKVTYPRGIKVVEAGETVTFELSPSVFGRWNEATQSTATVGDNLPAQTPYVFGSERFSIDGGLNWMTFAEYQASDPAVTVTPAGSAVGTSGHSPGADPLRWDFSDIQIGEQLPLIQYDVRVKDSVTSGRFRNTATLDSDFGVDNDEDGAPDQASSIYDLSMEAGTGFDVLKTVGDLVAETDGEINFTLLYKNLGLEDYSAGSFIDILPFVGDDAAAGGNESGRSPGSDFSGTFDLVRLSGGNSETFFATDRDPTEIAIDPCDSSNLAAGEVPESGDLCFTTFSRNGNTLPDGASAGSGATEWVQCTGLNPVSCGSLDPTAITAVRFDTGRITGAGGGHSVTITLEADGNVGGSPVFTEDGRVDPASTGDLYTNTFGGRIPEISLPVISNDVSVTVVSGSIGDRVWLDDNGDGVQDPGEAGVEGITVNLLADNGDGTFTVVATTTTGPDGSYTFDDLPSGRYKIEVVPSGPLATLGQTYDYDGAGDSASIRDLYGPGHPAPGRVSAEYSDVDDVVDQDFGYDPTPGSLGDRVWLDINGDGIQDPAEPGLEGIIVSISGKGLDGISGTADDISREATTDANGNYLFTDLPLGDYSVWISKSQRPAGMDQSGDPDGTLDNGSAYTLTSTEPSNLDQDFGYTGGGLLGDTVWLDLNGDGQQDPDEPGIAGVEVTLAAPGPDGIAGTADDIERTAVTDSAGNYLFSGLLADDYTVTVNTDTLPAGVTATGDFDGGEDSTSATTLDTDDDIDLDQDFGYVGPGKIGDTIWLDTNSDGVQDPGEPGLGGVDVTITWAGADGVVGTDDDVDFTTTTDATGNYSVAGLPLGDYAVTVDPATLPAGVTTQTGDPDDEADNTSALTLTEETPENLDQDFRYVGDGTIGDTVWYDVNADGVMDDTEPGIAGIEVTVTWAGVDGIAGTADDYSTTTTTDDNGNYLVTGLPFGDYIVNTATAEWTQTYDATGELDQTSNTSLSAEAPTDLDQDFGFTGPGSLGDTIWLDLDADGTQDLGEPGLAGVAVTATWAGPDGIAGTDDDIAHQTVTDADGNYLFTDLALGDYEVVVDTDTLPDGVENTFDLDGNLDSASAATLTIDEPSDLDHDFGYAGPGEIGNTIWHDADGDGTQDPNETGIAGVEVTITWAGPDGIIGTDDDIELPTTTDINGDYHLGGLPLGDYTVAVTPPDGYDPTFDPDGAIDDATAVNLTVAAPAAIADFGYRIPPEPNRVLAYTDTTDRVLAYTGANPSVLVMIAAAFLCAGAIMGTIRRRDELEDA